MKRIREIAAEVARENEIDIWGQPYAFAEEVALRACKQYVETALKTAAISAVAKEDPSDYGTGEIWVDKESILKSYPLTNIK